MNDPEYCQRLQQRAEQMHASRKQGFVGVSKLVGAERKLFQILLSEFHERFCESFGDYHDYYDGNFTGDELLEMVTPHHRVQLVAEVAVGLLVPSQPLPPDTVLHHATFFNIMYTSLITAMEIEIDATPREDEMMDQAGDGYPTPSDLGDTPEERRHNLAETHAEMASSGAAFMKKEKREAKLEKKAARKNGLRDADDELLHSMHATGAAEALNAYDKEAELNRFTEQFNKLSSQGDVLRPRDLVDTEAVPWHQDYRAHYSNLTIERSLQHGQPCALLPEVGENDMGIWLTGMRIGYANGLLHVPEEDDLIQDRGMDSLAGKLARRVLLERTVCTAQKLFEDAWTAEQQEFSTRCIMVLSSCGVSARHGFSRLMPQSADQQSQPTCTEMLEMLQSGSESKMPPWERNHTIRDLDKMAWTDDYHASLRAKGDGTEGYGRFDDVYEVVSQVGRLKFNPSIQRFVLYGNAPSPVEASGHFLDHPSIWRKKMAEANREHWCDMCHKTGPKNAFKACSRCKTRLYCSPQCQKADWKKSHKKYCESMREQAKVDKGAFKMASQSAPEPEPAPEPAASIPCCRCCGDLETASQALLRCAACKGVQYCGRACQKTDWKRHKLECDAG
jgi:hypothetical protein